MTVKPARRRTRDALQHWSARLLLVALVAFAANFLQTSRVHAQTKNYAAGFLLQPVGARSVGHGEAAAADTTLGTEGLWWNPAAMARMRKREFAVHHAQIFLAQADMIGIAYPSKALGTIAASAFLVNYGDSDATDSTGNFLGVLSNRYYVLSVGYASPIGKRFSAGFTAKRVMLQILCSGCPTTQNNRVGNTNALDVGAQYVLPLKSPIVLGASIRNIGEALQAKDAEQADPLPKVVQLGVQGKVPIAALAKNMTTLDLRGDLLLSPAYTSPSIRVGADLTYKELYTLRAGYKHLGPNDGVEGGLTAGIGLKAGPVQFDLARRFDSSSTLGESSAPTYFSLRYVF